MTSPGTTAEGAGRRAVPLAAALLARGAGGTFAVALLAVVTARQGAAAAGQLAAFLALAQLIGGVADRGWPLAIGREIARRDGLDRDTYGRIEHGRRRMAGAFALAAVGVGAAGVAVDPAWLTSTSALGGIVVVSAVLGGGLRQHQRTVATAVKFLDRPTLALVLDTPLPLAAPLLIAVATGAPISVLIGAHLVGTALSSLLGHRVLLTLVRPRDAGSPQRPPATTSGDYWLLSFGGIGMASLPVVVLALVADDAALGVFSLLQRSFGAVGVMLNGIAAVWIPPLARAHYRQDLARYRTVLRESLVVSLGLYTLAAVVALAVGSTVVPRLAAADGSGLTVGAVGATYLLLLGGQAVNAATTVSPELAATCGHERTLRHLLLASCALLVVGIPMGHLLVGLPGAAAAVLVALAVLNVPAMALVSRPAWTAEPPSDAPRPCPPARPALLTAEPT